MSFSQQPSLNLSDRNSDTLSHAADAQIPLSLKNGPRRVRRGNLFLDLPIAGRLAIGFLIAALVAALAAGIVGIQRSQSLSRQTDFYHNLLKLNTSLTSGRSFLELMNLKLQQTLDDASVPQPSRETLASDISALNNLAELYTQTLAAYTQNNLLIQHPEQMALLEEAGNVILASQQRTLTDSTQRTWQFYQQAQQQILDYLVNGDLNNAQLLLKQQGEPTNADARSALHSLIQLNDRLASAVDNATNRETQNQLLTTLIATTCAFLAIALVGWFISDTLVRRLRDLHRVTRAVEEGRINERAPVFGRDEIADVSEAVNTMLDTITGLLNETRQQRDALTGAAEHLFSDMRVVNAGDLRVSATVSNDPIGMLANAFNFTVGRFRRFILRTQTTIEQLEVISRQGQERSHTFISYVRAHLRDNSPVRAQPLSNSPLTKSSQTVSGSPFPRPDVLRKTPHSSVETGDLPLHAQQVPSVSDEFIQDMHDDLFRRLAVTRETLEKASRSVGRLGELISTRTSIAGNVTEKMTQAQLQELTSLENVLAKLARDLQLAQINAGSNFTRIDTTFKHLLHQVSGQSATLATEAIETMNSPSEAEFQELLRQAGSFATEVNALTKRLAIIIQEMRTGIVPFRLEGSMNMDAHDLVKSAPGQPVSEARPTSSGNLISNR